MTLPTYYISHGGGPWPWIKDQMGVDYSVLEESLAAMPGELGSEPDAVLMVSAHWVTPEFAVQSGPNPGMLYDYGGFPEFTYHIEYPAPGAPQVAVRVVELLAEAGMSAHQDPGRGFDHGMFAPMYAIYPDANVPTLQLSVRSGYDPAEHIALGRALAPLRDEGVLVVASGLSYHNLGLMGPAAAVPSREFDDWLAAVLTGSTGESRSGALVKWEAAPSARVAHPQEDHLIPLMVAVGAAEEESGHRTYHQHDFMGSVTASSYRFGEAPAHSLLSASTS